MSSRTAPRKPSSATSRALRWWLAPSLSAVWRWPLVLVLAIAGAWYIFRGLVHLAFLFDANPVGTFLFAPALMPFAGLPAFCMWAYFAIVPAIWPSRSTTTRVALAAGGPLLTWTVAQFLDLLQINLIRLLGIPLPRLPLDPY